MDERPVSINGVTPPFLDEPLFVVATQTLGSSTGPTRYPESQLDRFLVRLSIGYPPPEVERGLRDPPTVPPLVAVPNAQTTRNSRAATRVRVGPVELPRVLCRDHEEGLVQRVGDPVNKSVRSSIASSSALWVFGRRARFNLVGRDTSVKSCARNAKLPLD